MNPNLWHRLCRSRAIVEARMGRMKRSRVAWVAIFALSLPLAACGSSSEGPSGSGDRLLEPGKPVAPIERPGMQEARNQLQIELDGVSDWTADDLLDRYGVAFSDSLSYDPLQADGLSLIQASSLGLDADETARLAQNGFVITARQEFPTFTYGYETIYLEDLPVYISADSVLYAVHRSYDTLLERIEEGALIPALDGMLDEMRRALTNSGLPLTAQQRADADLYLTVALSLLRGQSEPPAAGASSVAIESFLDNAEAASAWQRLTLFGVERDIDFSMFTPRGHYANSQRLTTYFRAMTWLGRLDFRIIETQPDGSQVFHRRQLEGALALRWLMNDQARRSYDVIDRAITAFVGEHDYMTVPELDDLIVDLGLQDASALTNLGDGEIAQAVLDGGYGAQRISSHIMINGLTGGTLPLSSSFALMGQRYVIDSHVFSNVVYDRAGGGDVARMMPDPLDAAFAALANDHAGQLLEPELRAFDYAPDLASMRLLADAHPPEFWQTNLYNLWLGALRGLSPSGAVEDPASAGIPLVSATEPWGRRILNTQLASWAELRHDTILYAKQSFTAGGACEFPDAYVDPYPDTFLAIASLAEQGKALAVELPWNDTWTADGVSSYFDALYDTALRLHEIAARQRTGTPLTPDQLAFVNEAVATVSEGCTGEADSATGWYARLFLDRTKAVEWDPTIADVHTQPTDIGGTPVGRVLHVGTGRARLMVVTVDTCSGPRAYAGLASSYYETITEDFERLDDDGWRTDLDSGAQPEPEWVDAVVQR